MVDCRGTVGGGDETPRRPRGSTKLPLTNLAAPLSLAKGDERARCNMGSTVVLVLPRDAIHWDARLQPGETLRMGSMIGRMQPSAAAQTTNQA